MFVAKEIMQTLLCKFSEGFFDSPFNISQVTYTLINVNEPLFYPSTIIHPDIILHFLHNLFHEFMIISNFTR